MKRTLIAFLAATLCVLAADPSGKWSGSMKPTDGSDSHPLYLILKVDGIKLSGSGGPNETDQHPMENGRIEGDRLIFAVPVGKGTFYFDLKIKTDEIEGNVEVKGDENHAATVSLKRIVS